MRAYKRAVLVLDNVTLMELLTKPGEVAELNVKVNNVEVSVSQTTLCYTYVYQPTAAHAPAIGLVLEYQDFPTTMEGQPYPEAALVSVAKVSI